MILLADTFTISDHFLSALEYGDYSDLSDSDIEDLNNFLNDLPSGSKYWEYGDKRHFSQDVISGLMTDCYDVKLYMKDSDLNIYDE